MIDPKLQVLKQRVTDSINSSAVPDGLVQVDGNALAAFVGYVTPLSQKEYVDGGGLNCPYCHAMSLMFDDNLGLSGPIVMLRCECENCHMVWEKRYELTGYTAL
jgi:hypothetical protein